MAGLSSISGLVAGFDTKGAVDELLGVRQFEISQLKGKQDAEVARQEALLKINDGLSALRSTSIGMADASAFFSYTASLASSSASVPASTLLDVSGTNAVSAGQHTIVVQQLAQAERLSSSSAVLDGTGTPAGSATTPLNLTGTFQINGASVSVSAADSLQDIAATINQLNTGASATGVSASVIKVADNDYRLTLTADTTGAAGFTLGGADLDAAGALAGLQLGASGQTNARQVLKAAQDAQISIDGLSITRSSNSISDALEGVTLSLKQADAAVTVNMSIGVDQTALREKVQSFVDAYNNVQSMINEQFQFDADTGTSGVLAGEALLTTIQSTLASSLLSPVPGLAADRNSLAMIGVEPDSKGQLFINEDRFSPLLASDPDAIRDVFVANGSSVNNDLQFLTNGLNTPSGTYTVNITQPAMRASVTGSADLTAGLAASEMLTITETGSARQALVNLTAGQTQSQILAALNAEFSKVSTETHQLGTALQAGASPATASNTFADLGLSVTAGDTISINGTSRSGAAISGTYTVIDPATDTLSGLLSAIQSQFNQQVIASIDAGGHIQITDTQSGDSQLSLTLTANNEGGGTLSFGADSVTTEGRFAMNVEAVAAGNGIRIQSTSYGSSSGFSITQSADGLGIADQSVSGVDVAGTINGLAATGSGQLLLGSTGDVDGLGLLYTGATTTTSDVVVGVGIAAAFDGMLDLFANPVTGLLQNRVASSQSSYDTLAARIADLEAQMEQQRTILTQSFTRMEQAMATLQQSGDFLTQQINAQNANN